MHVEVKNQRWPHLRAAHITPAEGTDINSSLLTGMPQTFLKNVKAPSPQSWTNDTDILSPKKVFLGQSIASSLSHPSAGIIIMICL